MTEGPEEIRRWFDRRTFHHAEFSDLGALLRAKQEQDVSISVCIPALNEAGTVGPIVREVRESTIESVPLVDELVVVDSYSEDDTARIAEDEGAVVVQDREVLPRLPAYSGKGEAMWKSLFVLKGDIILWVDADIENFHARFVYGPLGPILTNPEISFVKAFYDRPIRYGSEYRPTEGGRVTELMARPLLNTVWPALGGLVQPLSGEYAGRRSVLEQIPFFTGYGIELGMVVDVAERFGMDAIAQVDLERRVHRNRSIRELSRMATAILHTAFLRLRSQGKVSVDPGTTLLQFARAGDRYQMQTAATEVHERPPASTIPEYRSR